MSSYISKNTIEEILEDPDFVIKLASKVKEDKSYIDFAKSITSSNDGITFGEFAKILNNDDKKIGRNSLYKWFRDKGYVIKNGSERNIPKQKYVNRGLFKVEEKIVMSLDWQPLGVLEANGILRQENNEAIGCVNHNGEVYDKDMGYIGSVSNAYYAFDLKGNPLGLFDKTGQISLSGQSGARLFLKNFIADKNN